MPRSSDPEVSWRDAPLQPWMKYASGGLRVLWKGSGKLPWHDLEILARTGGVLLGKGLLSGRVNAALRRSQMS